MAGAIFVAPFGALILSRRSPTVREQFINRMRAGPMLDPAPTAADLVFKFSSCLDKEKPRSDFSAGAVLLSGGGRCLHHHDARDHPEGRKPPGGIARHWVKRSEHHNIPKT